MPEYVSKILLEVNGQQIDDFKKVREGEREVRKVIQLARGIGTVRVVRGYPLEVDYVIPKDAPEIDFEAMFDSAEGTLTIDYENGVRKSYGGVTLVKVGKAEYPDEDGVTVTIEMVATKKAIV